MTRGEFRGFLMLVVGIISIVIVLLNEVFPK